MAEMTRRDLAKLLLVVPVAGMAPRLARADDPSPEARLIAEEEKGLSADERERLLKGLADQEKTVRTVRDFGPIPNDVAPAFVFRPRASRKRA